MLLEKCWAKIHKSYLAIEQFTMKDGFRVLAGIQPEYAYLKDDSDEQIIFQKLEEAVKKKYVVTMSTSSVLS
jgi:succinyl-CoA synthetase alpha subunit